LARPRPAHGVKLSAHVERLVKAGGSRALILRADHSVSFTCARTASSANRPDTATRDTTLSAAATGRLIVLFECKLVCPDIQPSVRAHPFLVTGRAIKNAVFTARFRVQRLCSHLQGHLHVHRSSLASQALALS
jgi:hypothetical protein